MSKIIFTILLLFIASPSCIRNERSSCLTKMEVNGEGKDDCTVALVFALGLSTEIKDPNTGNIFRKYQVLYDNALLRCARAAVNIHNCKQKSNTKPVYHDIYKYSNGK